MKLLRDLLYKVKLETVKGLTNMAIDSISFDSRKPMKFGFFVAIKGELADGHDFIDQAIEKGAVAICCEVLPKKLNSKTTYVQVEDSRRALGEIASNFYDHPSERMKVVGVTGTNGKTSTVTLLYNLYKNLGKKVGLISTIINRINELEFPSRHTTPDPVMLNSLMSQMVNNGCQYCFMEVSSHALNQKRIQGIRFTIAVFTNLTHDHIDYHANFKVYMMAKKSFFDNLEESASALINDDDKYGEKMVTQTRAKKRTYAFNNVADFKGKIIESRFEGLLLNIDGEEVWIKLPGRFNAYNILAVYSVARMLGSEKTDILKILSSLNAVEGRFQLFRARDNISAIVDYAHTPDALEKVMETIQEIRTGNELVITVMGCGGNRDKGKRPLMGQIAATYSEKVILTSDNPRNEDADAIIEDIYAGIDAGRRSRVVKITDRKEAIKTACAMARNGDILLVAGKGHEKYQEIKGQRFAFDDMKILKEALKYHAV